jgi:hypothetical protein
MAEISSRPASVRASWGPCHFKSSRIARRLRGSLAPGDPGDPADAELLAPARRLEVAGGLAVAAMATL